MFFSTRTDGMFFLWIMSAQKIPTGEGYDTLFDTDVVPPTFLYQVRNSRAVLTAHTPRKRWRSGLNPTCREIYDVLH
jgi:hypothetical protein